MEDVVAIGLGLGERPDVHVRWAGPVSTDGKALGQCPDSRIFISAHIIIQ